MRWKGAKCSLLPVKLDHLQRLTDDTGLLEHAFGKIPRRKEGYSTDDNARALWMCIEWIRYAERTNAAEAIPLLCSLADKYLEFLIWVQGEDGRFHNNVFYNRTFEPEVPSDDCQGRTLWALAVASLDHPDKRRIPTIRKVCQRGFSLTSALQFPRGMAHTLSAAATLLTRMDEVQGDDVFVDWAKRELPQVVEHFAEHLCQLYATNQRPQWHWFEPTMTYANGVFPWALFGAYQVLEDENIRFIAETSLAFLIERMTPGGVVRPIGNRGWAGPNHMSVWDQQPLEVMKLALASAKAFEVTGEVHYQAVLKQCVAWFYGENDAGQPLADAEDGGCCDGINEDGLNPNQGAESTLSYLLTEAIYHNAWVEGGHSHGNHIDDTQLDAAKTRVSRV